MALIKCPECGKQVSDTVENCIHCGFKLVTDSSKMTSTTTTYKVSDDDNTTATLNNDLTTVTIRSGYDVMLVDYRGSMSNAIKVISNLMGCTEKDAQALLKNLPAYLYTDIDYDDAVALCRRLQAEGMRVNLFDPVGKILEYKPVNYTNTMPQYNYNNISRDPFFQMLPQLLLMNTFRMLTSRSINSIPRTVVYQKNRPTSYRTGSNFFGGPGSKRGR